MSALCCLGTTTDLTPGFWSAVATGSWLELDELLDELPPHAASPTIAAAAVKDRTTCLAIELTPLMIPPRQPHLGIRPFCVRLIRRPPSPPSRGGYPAAGSANRNRSRRAPSVLFSAIDEHGSGEYIG